MCVSRENLLLELNKVCIDSRQLCILVWLLKFSDLAFPFFIRFWMTMHLSQMQDWHPDSCSRQYTVELGMTLVSAHRDELEVQCDDDKWSHLRLTKSHFGLQRHLVFLLVETYPCFLKVLLWDLDSLRVGPAPLGRFSEFVVSSWQFCCSICDWEHEVFTFFDVNTSFALNLRAWISDASNFPAIKTSPFQIPCATNANSRNTPGKTFLPNWWNLDWSLAEIGWYSTIAPNGMTRPLNGSPNRRS